MCRHTGAVDLISELERKSRLHDELIEVLGDLDIGLARVESAISIVQGMVSINEQNRLQQLNVSTSSCDVQREFWPRVSSEFN